MARRDMDPTSQDRSRDDDRMDQDDRVRGRADEMEDATRDDFEDTDDDLGEEDIEEGEGSF